MKASFVHHKDKVSLPNQEEYLTFSFSVFCITTLVKYVKAPIQLQLAIILVLHYWFLRSHNLHVLHALCILLFHYLTIVLYITNSWQHTKMMEYEQFLITKHKANIVIYDKYKTRVSNQLGINQSIIYYTHLSPSKWTKKPGIFPKMSSSIQRSSFLSPFVPYCIVRIRSDQIGQPHC